MEHAKIVGMRYTQPTSRVPLASPTFFYARFNEERDVSAAPVQGWLKLVTAIASAQLDSAGATIILSDDHKNSPSNKYNYRPRRYRQGYDYVATRKYCVVNEFSGHNDFLFRYR